MSLLQELVNEIKPVLLKAGIKEPDIDRVFWKHIDVTYVTHQVNLIRNGEVQEWLRIRAKVTPSMWDYYEATNERELVECRQLIKASRALRDAWSLKVVLFHREMKKRLKTIKDAEEAEALKIMADLGITEAGK